MSIQGEKTFITSALVGYRQWTFTGDGLRSMSMNSYSWTPGWNQADCMPFSIRQSKGHELSDVPNPSCTCGFYAHHIPMTSTARKNQVLGVIEASGNIVVGDTGFRAEKARIVALSGVYASDTFFRKVPGSKNQSMTSRMEIFCKENNIQFFHKPGLMIEAWPQISLSSLGVDIDALKNDRETALRIWKSQNTQAIRNRSRAKSDYDKQMAVMKSAADYINRGMRDYDIKDPRLKSTMDFLGGY